MSDNSIDEQWLPWLLLERLDFQSSKDALDCIQLKSKGDPKRSIVDIASEFPINESSHSDSEFYGVKCFILDLIKSHLKRCKV